MAGRKARSWVTTAHKRGRKSFHSLLAVAAGTRLCPYYRFRSGDTVATTQWESAMEECQVWLGQAQVWLNRGDLGLGHERVCAWHEAPPGRPHYLFRLKLTANVKRAIAAVPENDWQGPARLGVLQVAELTVRRPDWSRSRRVVVGRRWLGRSVRNEPAIDRRSSRWPVRAARVKYASYSSRVR